MSDALSAGAARPILELFGDDAVVSKWKGAEGIWIERECTLRLEDGHQGRWIILEGNFFEGVDQLSEARAMNAGKRLSTAYAVNPWYRRGSWILGLEAPDEGSIGLALPYVIDPGRGLFCTGYRVLDERPLLATPRLVFAAELGPDRSPPRKPAIAASPDAGKGVGIGKAGPDETRAAPAREAPPMLQRRRGILLSNMVLEGDASLRDDKIVFTGNDRAGRFIRPFRLSDRAFVPGDTVMFRPLIEAPAGQGVVIELHDDKDVCVAREEIFGATGDPSRTDGLRYDVTSQIEFFCLAIARFGSNDGPVVVNQVKLKITDAVGTIENTARFLQ